MYAFLGGFFRYYYDYENCSLGFGQDQERNNSAAQASNNNTSPYLLKSYLKEMDIDSSLLELVANKTGEKRLLLTQKQLEEFNMINNGKLPAKWTLNTIKEGMYLKGEQETIFGIGKSMLTCTENGIVNFAAMYSGNQYDRIIEATHGYSLRLGDEFLSLNPPKEPLEAKDGSLFIYFELPLAYSQKITSADSIGFAAHPANPDFFAGFTVDTKPGKVKIEKFIRGCLKQK